MVKKYKTNMRNNRIRLTESQLRRVIKESVRRVLRENVLDVYDKFDYVEDFKDGFAAVNLNGKWNYINTKGQILSKRWFDNVGDFSEGLASVYLKGKFNFINTNGQILSKIWFDSALDFKEGLSFVRLNRKYNFLKTNGQLLSPNQWFDGADEFDNGFAEVQLNGEWYELDRKGKLLREGQLHGMQKLTGSELYDRIDSYLSKIGDAYVSRFYSDENQITLAVQRDVPSKQIVDLMKGLGYKLYDSGANDNYIMMTFK